MSLKEKFEQLKKYTNELKKLEKKKADLKAEITKAVEVDDDTLDELNRQVDELRNTISRITAERDALEIEIEEAEKELSEVTEKSQKKNNEKGDIKKMDYLKTKAASSAFLELVKSGMKAAEIREKWEAHLVEKNISPVDFFLPQAAVDGIIDVFGDDREIWDSFSHTGLKMLARAINTTSNGTERAKGHKKGTTKAQEVITLTKKEIRAQIIYKYIQLDKETIIEQDDDNALLRYISEEMARQWYNEVARAAVIGDGRQANADDKISKIEAITAAGSTYTTTVTATASLYKDLVNAVAEIDAPGPLYAVMSKTTLAALKTAENTAGNFVFAPGADIAGAIGLERIFTPSFMKIQGAPTAVIYAGNAYKTVGRDQIDKYENFLLSTNSNEYLVEGYVGGGLAEAKAAAIIVAE